MAVSLLVCLLSQHSVLQLDLCGSMTTRLYGKNCTASFSKGSNASSLWNSSSKMSFNNEKACMVVSLTMVTYLSKLSLYSSRKAIVFKLRLIVKIVWVIVAHSLWKELDKDVVYDSSTLNKEFYK
ncbi:unnamed protein product [Mucor fragilis]